MLEYLSVTNKCLCDENIDRIFETVRSLDTMVLQKSVPQIVCTARAAESCESIYGSDPDLRVGVKRGYGRDSKVFCGETEGGTGGIAESGRSKEAFGVGESSDCSGSG